MSRMITYNTYSSDFNTAFKIANHYYEQGRRDRFLPEVPDMTMRHDPVKGYVVMFSWIEEI